MATEILKRKRIMSSATELFSRNPFHEVRMEDIARKASVAKGTLYYHFDSKEKLYENIVREGLDEILTDIRDCSGEDPVENLRIFIDRVAALILKNRFFYSVLQAGEPVGGGATGKCRGGVCSLKETLVKILEEGAALGNFRKDLDVGAVAEMILGMLKGAVRRPKSAGISLYIHDIIINGITKES
jgi:AcrR family transcriptional regulator